MEHFFLETQENDRIFCLVENEKSYGTWVICTHGLFQDKSESWFILSKIAKSLNDVNISICRYDSRGCGDSTNQAKDLELSAFFEDIDFIVKYIRDKYKPSKIILLGVGLGCISVCKALEKYDISAVILINPTFGKIFNLDEAFPPLVKQKAIDLGYIDMCESSISEYWLEKLHDAGSQYWNVLGQRINISIFKDLSNIRLEKLFINKNIKKCLTIISCKKEGCIEIYKQLSKNNQDMELRKIEAEPLFTNPRAQDEVVLAVKEWLKQNTEV